MTELLAVLTLHLRVIAGLRALLGEVTSLLAVAADSLRGILGLRALLGDVVLRIAVAAGSLGDVGALVTWSDECSPRSSANTYILRKMAGLIALAALDALSRARLGALLRIVAFLLAVLAGERVLALFGTIAGAVTVLLAVHALDSRGG